MKEAKQTIHFISIPLMKHSIWLISFSFRSLVNEIKMYYNSKLS